MKKGELLSYRPCWFRIQFIEKAESREIGDYWEGEISFVYKSIGVKGGLKRGLRGVRILILYFLEG